MSKVSIIVPWHYMPKWEMYLTRCLKSIQAQTFTDYEVIMLKYGRAAETQNKLINMASGEIVKILHMDDYFTGPSSLQKIVDNFTPEVKWLVSGCWHDNGNGLFYPHPASYAQDIHIGNNTIGAPSVITFRNGLGVYFDEDLDWLYDVSLYKKLNDAHGLPKVINDFTVTIGLHEGQLTHAVKDEQKSREVELMSKRYV